VNLVKPITNAAVDAVSIVIKYVASSETAFKSVCRIQTASWAWKLQKSYLAAASSSAPAA